MSNFKDRTELFFEQLARTLYRHPKKTLFLMVLLSCVVFYKLPALTVDTSAHALLHKTDKSRQIYDRFRDQFGQDRFIIISVTADNIFTPSFFERLKAFHADIEENVPYLKDVNSLITARHTWGNEDELNVEDLLEGWPEERQVDFDLLKKQVMNNPNYINYLVSPDGKTTAVILEADVEYVEGATNTMDALEGFDDAAFSGTSKDKPSKAVEDESNGYLSQAQNEELVRGVNKVMGEYEADGFELALAGGPVILNIFNNYTMLDMRRCFSLSFIVITFFMSILFRRVAGVVLPAIIVFAADFSALGLMAWFDVSFKMTTTVLPSFLLCVGVADSVHILAIFFKQLDKGHAKEDAIAYALGHSGLAVVLTTMTTAAALLSFSFAELTALGDLGLFAAIGVLLALVYTLVILPSALALLPLKRKTPKAESSGKSIMDRVLLWIANISTRYPFRIVGCSFAFFTVALIFVFNLQYSDNIVEYFPDDLPIKKDIQFIDRHLNGIMQVEVVIDTKKENGLYEPDLLNRIEKMAAAFDGYELPGIYVGKIITITDILKETHKALNENQNAFYRIPQDYNTIAQEFLLFENAGSDDLESIVDTQFSKTRASFKVPWVDSVILDTLIQDLHNQLPPFFGDTADITITGMAALMARTISAALNSMAKSYVLAFGVITVMMVLLVGQLKTGLVSMIPNVFPIVYTMGLMGAMNVPLDMTSLMIGSIAMGLVVDDTVHFIYNFQKYYYKTGNAYEAVRLTMVGVGRALLITSVVLSCGFFILFTASLTHIVRFGFFTGITIILALFADFLLAPALMIIITGAHRRKPVTVSIATDAVSAGSSAGSDDFTRLRQ
ncbi:MAG: MMPL family transporter [Thermodesulfobacteriota bacterium]|nr:MMPL family transporter [Thermodesulfobacteriota bacterium]